VIGASSRSAAISSRTICSGLCRLLFAMIMLSLRAPSRGPRTLISCGSTDRGEANRPCRACNW
jgi:hypothetical protein